MKMQELKKQADERLKELEDRLTQFKENIKSLEDVWTPEVVIRKRDGELGFPTYYLAGDGTVMININFPCMAIGYSGPHKVDVDEFARDYVEYTPRVRLMFPKG